MSAPEIQHYFSVQFLKNITPPGLILELLPFIELISLTISQTQIFESYIDWYVKLNLRYITDNF